MNSMNESLPPTRSLSSFSQNLLERSDVMMKEMSAFFSYCAQTCGRF